MRQSFSMLVQPRSFAAWLLTGALLVAGAMATTACQSPPEYRFAAEETRDEDGGRGVDRRVVEGLEQRLNEKTQRLEGLDTQISELQDELELTVRSLNISDGRIDAQRETISALETERDNLNEEVSSLMRNIEHLQRQAEERTFAPVVREPLSPIVFESGDRPDVPEGFKRHDEGSFGFDFPEDWEFSSRPLPGYVEFVLTAPQGDAVLRIHMWAYPRWNGQTAIEETLNTWLIQRVVEVPEGRARLHPDAGRAAPLVAGLPTIVAEYNYAAEDETPMRHRRALITLVDGDERHRSFQMDLNYERLQEERMDEIVEVWEAILGSFWLASVSN